MFRLRCAAVWVVVLGTACSVKNPAFDPDRASSETSSTADGAETGSDEVGQDGATTSGGDMPDEMGCTIDSLAVTDSVFVVHDEAPTCDVTGELLPVPCDLLAFGAFSEFPVYGLQSTGDTLTPWAAGPTAAYLLFHVEGKDIRGRDWEVISATMRVDLDVLPEATGELQARIMSSGVTNRWNRTTQGFGDPALDGETTFLHRSSPGDLWKDEDPVISAADIPLGSEPITGAGNGPMLQTAFIELSPEFFSAFLAQEVDSSNGLMLTSTDFAGFVLVDAHSIEFEFEICEKD